MSKLTDTQDAALAHVFTKYTEDTWNNIMSSKLLCWNAQVCDMYTNMSDEDIKECLISLEQMLQDFYTKGYSAANGC